MQPEILLPVTDPGLTSQLEDLAKRHRAASGPMMQVITFVGGTTESLLGRLPPPVRDGLQSATERGLDAALEAASRSRGVVSDRPDWVNKVLTTALGAAGGAGGLPSALAELPFTITMLLRAIQGIAAEHGFDPESDEVKLECLRVFASAGPLEADDGADMGFLTARMTITGAGLHGLVAKVAPRLAAALGQKLATQTVPVLGAVAGAAVNYAFTSYYQEIARVHFGLKRLARDSGEDEGLLREELVMRLSGAAPR
ncbi:EcsC family protein [Rhodobacter aestuarii]|uniref:EcsC protein family protein n=1 Tax=Rhodobacter aestuarii TaxID=453582 RepID=A0A1N7K1H5_9RHOB|nr:MULTISPECIES: EcsC family protein [Rhodobacter]PTV95899.1 EcsC family protein [Rhodobacter aestuarii]SIS55442.1 EcsC protein family protein [Rhodobacter aestuarii]SOC10994.1 EcsC family protein [Rhodobacter sp. JA431]